MTVKSPRLQRTHRGDAAHLPGVEGSSQGIPGKAEPSVSEQWRMSDRDYEALREVIFELLDIDLAYYRTQQMERRLTSLLHRQQKGDWRTYIETLRTDPDELARFREYLTINVSSFYRDADKWSYLAKTILPYLLRLRRPAGIEAWSVGCSIGAEAYTLAILLADQAPAQRHRVRGADIDTKVLDRAMAGGPYTESEVRELPKHLLAKYLIRLQNRLYVVRPAIRDITEFEYFDLLQDKPTQQFDLILCRNVVIYFTPETKLDVYQRLGETLRPGGILFIGSTETISKYRELGFDYIAPSFYRRRP